MGWGRAACPRSQAAVSGGVHHPCRRKARPQVPIYQHLVRGDRRQCGVGSSRAATLARRAAASKMGVGLGARSRATRRSPGHGAGRAAAGCCRRSGGTHCTQHPPRGRTPWRAASPPRPRGRVTTRLHCQRPSRSAGTPAGRPPPAAPPRSPPDRARGARGDGRVQVAISGLGLRLVDTGPRRVWRGSSFPTRRVPASAATRLHRSWAAQLPHCHTHA